MDNSLKRKQEQYEKELTNWQTKYQNAGKALLKVYTVLKALVIKNI